MDAFEAKVIALIAEIGPVEAFRQLTAANDRELLSPVLDNGRRLARERTLIYTTLVREWAAKQHASFGYDKPFAVVALGGTGRMEMTPCSDNDFAFLFEDALEDNAFLLHLQEQILYGPFKQAYGFKCESLPFTLSDIPNLDGKQLNAFLDMRPVYDPDGFTDLFRERIRDVYDPFKHFLHLRAYWEETWKEAALECERLDRFDIKNQGLRVFLAGIWLLAGERFQPSWEIYEHPVCSEKDLADYAFLLRIRGYAQLRHPNLPPGAAPGNHPEDILTFEDFVSFGELLGNDANELEKYNFANAVRARLLSARRRVGRFAQGVMQRALRDGRPIRRGSPIVLGLGGLTHAPLDADSPSKEEKSAAALSLLVASRRYGLPVDPSELHHTFLNIGEWLVLTPQLAELFYEERGSLAEVFAFLASTDGAEERLFPGYAKFESSLDGRVMHEQRFLRGALERDKLRLLEEYVREGKQRLAQAVSEYKLTDVGKNLSVQVEAALLNADQLAAIRLALKTKRLPLTEADLEAREDETRTIYERLSSGISGIPLEEYYERYAEQGGFAEPTLALTQFLIQNQRAFREFAKISVASQEQVERFVDLCQSEEWLRALYVFNHADQGAWQSPDTSAALLPDGFNVSELYIKGIEHYHPRPGMQEQMVRAGFTPDHLDVLEDLKGIFTGAYRELSHRFLYHLIELTENPDKGPLVRMIWDGPTSIVGVAAKDYRGLAASITGALAEMAIPLVQVHIFSAKRYGLALDFFHVDLPDRSKGPEMVALIDEVIREKRYINAGDEAELVEVRGKVSLEPWDDEGRYRLMVETDGQVNGTIHALTYRLHQHLGANISGLTAYTVRGTVFIAVYHDLPETLTLEEAKAIAAEKLVRACAP